MNYGPDAMNYLLLLCLTLLIPPQQVSRVIDGDTFILHHVGVPPEERVRILEIDTPERGQSGFFEARNFTAHWLSLSHFTLQTCKRDSFGRLLATVTRDGASLADALYNAGLGVRP